MNGLLFCFPHSILLHCLSLLVAALLIFFQFGSPVAGSGVLWGGSEPALPDLNHQDSDLAASLCSPDSPNAFKHTCRWVQIIAGWRQKHFI